MKKIKIVLVVAILFASKSMYSQVKYIGEIRLMATNFAPRGWSKCEGQILLISQNQALFSLLGTQYGGNGTSNFALPDLRGRANVGYSGDFDGVYPIGTSLGTETVTLTTANLPAHTHNVVLTVNNASATLQQPATSTYLSNTVVQADGSNFAGLTYNNLAPNVNLNSGQTNASGQSQAISVLQPYLPLTYMIATSGTFPSRP